MLQLNLMERKLISPEIIQAFCRKHHIRSLAFFGSVVRDDFRPESDIDVLVEFEEGHTPGLVFFALEHCSQVKHINKMSRASGQGNGVNLPHERRPQTQEK